MRQFPYARLAAAIAVGLFAASLAGCSVMDRIRPGAKASKASASAGVSEDQIDPRQFLGPNYCPELRVYAGAQLIRTYERGHDGDPKAVKWQASMGKTARECLYDAQGGLTLKVGISGRAVTGPKGEGDSITLPVKIAVVKYKESVIASERFSLSVAIPPQGSTVFREVKEMLVPSPGRDRDYIIYVGFGVEDWDPMKAGGPALLAAKEPEPEPEPAPPLPVMAEPEPEPAPPPKQAKTPKELPTPTGGFVLTQ